MTWASTFGTGFGGTIAGAGVGVGGAPAYDADAQAYFDEVELDNTHKTAINTLVLGLKADGLWEKIDRLWLLANETETAAKTCVKTAGNVLTAPEATPAFVADEGYTGNGVDAYFNTGFNPVTVAGQYGGNSAHIMLACGSAADIDAGFSYDAGAFEAASSSISIQTGDTGAYMNINDLEFAATTGVTSTRGIWVGSRTAAAIKKAYHDGVECLSSTQASGGSPDLPFYLFVGNNMGTPDSPSVLQFRAASWGAGLNSTEAANLTTRIEAYLEAIGAGVIA